MRGFQRKQFRCLLNPLQTTMEFIVYTYVPGGFVPQLFSKEHRNEHKGSQDFDVYPLCVSSRSDPSFSPPPRFSSVPGYNDFTLRYPLIARQTRYRVPQLGLCSELGRASAVK